tara:strand:- start:861 stop:2462 length:1602 start_codon:yes stop_codon:yes gene_type:complete
MALNLTSPQFKPNVVGAAQAAEQIVSSQASTSLAERKLGEDRRQFSENLNLRREAQGVSLAAQRQKTAQEAAMFPVQLLDAQNRAQGAALSNMLNSQQLIKNEAMFPLEVDRASADLEATVIRTEIETNNLAKQRGQMAQMPKVNEWLNAANIVASSPDWGLNESVVLPPMPVGVTGANAVLIQRRIAELNDVARDNGRGLQERTIAKYEADRGAALRQSGAADIDEHNRQIAEAYYRQNNIPVPPQVDPTTFLPLDNKWWDSFLNESGIVDVAKMDKVVTRKRADTLAAHNAQAAIAKWRRETKDKESADVASAAVKIFLDSKKSQSGGLFGSGLGGGATVIEDDATLMKKAVDQARKAHGLAPRITTTTTGGDTNLLNDTVKKMSADEMATAKTYAEKLVALGEWIEAKGGLSADGKSFKADTASSWHKDIDFELNDQGKWYVQEAGWLDWDDYDSSKEGAADLVEELGTMLKGKEHIDEFLMRYFAPRWDSVQGTGGRKYKQSMGIPGHQAAIPLVQANGRTRYQPPTGP